MYFSVETCKEREAVFAQRTLDGVQRNKRRKKDTYDPEKWPVIKCEACDKLFEVQLSQVKIGQGKFCSHRCARSHQIPKSVREVRAEVYVQRKRDGVLRNPYRRNDIQDPAIWAVKMCQVCGKLFEVQPQQNKRGEGKTCSIKCKAAATKAAIPGSRTARDLEKYALEWERRVWDGVQRNPERKSNKSNPANWPVKTCKVCGRLFEIRRSSTWEQKLCGSKKCHEHVLEILAEEFSRRARNGVKRNTSRRSNACDPAAYPIRTCQNCGVLFEARRCGIRQGGGIFCSRKCSSYM